MKHLTWVSALDGELADASIPRRARLWLIAGLTVMVAVTVFAWYPQPAERSVQCPVSSGRCSRLAVLVAGVGVRRRPCVHPEIRRVALCTLLLGDRAHMFWVGLLSPVAER
jgi:hypothetical protein